MTDLTQERLRKSLTYDPKTGIFIWRRRNGSSPNVRAWNTKFANKSAGTMTKPRGDGLRYLQIHIKGKCHLAHRLAWLYMTGEWPRNQTDHEDGDGLNNRWKNLRDATGMQNQANRGVQPNNISGYKGVSFRKSSGRYLARIGVRKKIMHLGSFDTPHDAHAAYMAAARKYFGEFANG